MLHRLHCLFCAQNGKLQTREGRETARNYSLLPVFGRTVFPKYQLPEPFLDQHSCLNLRPRSPQGNSPGPQGRLRSPGIQKQPPMCAPSSLGQGPWEHQSAEPWEPPIGGVPSPRLLPGTRGGTEAVECTMQPLISARRGEAREGGRGHSAAQPDSPCTVRPWPEEQLLPASLQIASCLSGCGTFLSF